MVQGKKLADGDARRLGSLPKFHLCKFLGRTNNTKGFTLTELVVASLFVLIVMGTLYGFYREQLYSLLTQETKTATLEEARGALDIMVRELRNAGAWTSSVKPAGCQRFVAATAAQVQIQADLDGNGDCASVTGEDVTYSYLSTGTTSCPAGRIARNGNCLVGNVVPQAPNKLFTYYDASGTDLGGAPPLSSIKRIEIAFSVQLSNPNPYASAAVPNVSTTLSSSVDLRN